MKVEQLIDIVIHDINIIYVDFNKRYYSMNYNHGKFNKVFKLKFDTLPNLRNTSIHEFMNDTYFTNCLLNNYLLSLKKDVVPQIIKKQVEYKLKKYPFRFRQRTKLMDSTNRKIEDYLKREKKMGSFKVSKAINDLYGCRIILKDVNMHYRSIDKLLGKLRNKGLIHRYYHRDDHGYKAFHCYFQNVNIYFPWELQIWDKSDKDTNFSKHHYHVLKRKKRLEA